MSKLFQRKVEDFNCQNCGQLVKANGYTNHCPHCLWSRHVDLNPGDRLNSCKAMMAPVGIKIRGSQYYIVHRCSKCQAEKVNKTCQDDNYDEILRLAGTTLI